MSAKPQINRGFLMSFVRLPSFRPYTQLPWDFLIARSTDRLNVRDMILQHTCGRAFMGQSSSKGSSEVSRTSPLSGLHHRQTEQAQLDHLSAAQRQSQAVCPSLSGRSVRLGQGLPQTGISAPTLQHSSLNLLFCRPVMHCTAQSGTVPAIPASEFASETGRGFAYTAYEANAWEATFFKSGQ